MEVFEEFFHPHLKIIIIIHKIEPRYFKHARELPDEIAKFALKCKRWRPRDIIFMAPSAKTKNIQLISALIFSNRRLFQFGFPNWFLLFYNHNYDLSNRNEIVSHCSLLLHTVILPDWTLKEQALPNFAFKHC